MNPRVALILLLAALHIPQIAIAQDDLQTINTLLLHQIDYLNSVNSQLSRLIIGIITVAGLLLGGSILAGFFQFRSALKKIREKTSQAINDGLVEQLAKGIQGRLDQVERIDERENVIETTSVTYCSLGETDYAQELSQIAARGFTLLRQVASLNRASQGTDIVVIDLRAIENDETAIQGVLDQVSAQFEPEIVMVFYLAEHSDAIRKFGKSRLNTLVANMPIRLIAACVEAAHFAASLKRSRTEL